MRHGYRADGAPEHPQNGSTAMDLETLRGFSTEVFGAVPGDQLTDLHVWCRDYGEATGDARFLSVGDTIRSIDDWWNENEERGGVPTQLLEQIATVIRTLLPSILDLKDPADAAPLARALREAVQELLVGPREWVRRGWATKP
jgi:hypothetical protein